MANVTGRWLRARDAAPGDRARASWGENLVTVLLITITAIGGTLDAWAHANLDRLDTFFTPWHAVVYIGFVASSAWIGLLVVRHAGRGRRGLAAVPVGYGLGIVGVIVFAGGGLFDLAWHSTFGIEVGIEPLLSPPHLMLGLGGLLMESSSLRAMWAETGQRHVPGLGAVFPAVLSAALVAGDLSFFLMWASPFLQIFPADEIAGAIAAVLITNVIYVGTLLLLLRRWRLPFGACTFLLCFDAALASAIVGFRTWPTLLAALAGGVAADLLIHRLRPSPSRPAAMRAMAGLTSVALWGSYILIVWLIGALDWSVPLWSGVIMLAAGSSVALAVLTSPPPIPAMEPTKPAPQPEPVRAGR